MDPKQPRAAASRVLVVIGTRPEAIKLGSVITALRSRPRIRTMTCATGQHRDLVAEPLALFGVEVDADLQLMRAGQTTDEFLPIARSALVRLVERWRPRIVVVQGDTATALAGAQAGYACGIAVAHVEAGLRSGNPASPYPEELYRRAITRLATLHFAPTQSAREALLAESAPSTSIHDSGNSGIDALHAALARLEADPRLGRELADRFAFIDPSQPLILATAHRRESFGAPLAAIIDAIERLAAAKAVQILIPVHPNPTVREAMEYRLGGMAGVHLTGPLDYLALIYNLRRARMVLTDSGGLQEEAPALGVPVLVMRNATERPEGIATGNALLVGTDSEAIVEASIRLLDDGQAHAAMATARSPYGDGHAGERIAHAIASWLADAGPCASKSTSA